MYGERGGASEFNQVHRLIQESYASYVGYYLGESYYRSQGYTKTSVNENITGQGRQWWKKTAPTNYSPLFVDLIDNYNQGASTSGPYNYDTIKNFPHTTIQTMAATCTDKSAIQSKLQEYVGVYITPAVNLPNFCSHITMLCKIEDHEKSFNTDNLSALLPYVGSIV